MSDCEDKSIALTITSPPYWNAISYDTHTIDNDADYRERDYTSFGITYLDWLTHIKIVFTQVREATVENGVCAIVIGTILDKGLHYPAPFDVLQIMQEIGWVFWQDIIWNKVTAGVRRAGSFIQHPKPGYYYPNIMTEYILLFCKGHKLRKGEIQEIEIDNLFTRDIANNIWHIAPVPPQTVDHPCPFPDEIVRRLLLLYSQPSDTILDPFMGSGTTAKVALQHNRKCVGYETEEQYIKLIKERISEKQNRKYNLIPKIEKLAFKDPKDPQISLF